MGLTLNIAIFLMLVVLLCESTLIPARNVSAFWAYRTKLTAAAYPQTFRGKSKGHCAVTCMKVTGCLAFSFVQAQDICNLYSSVQDTGAGSVQAWVKTAKDCPLVTIANADVSYRNTAKWLEGDVICHSGFMLSAGSASNMTCQPDGTWYPPNIQCLQYQWTNPVSTLTGFQIPRPTYVGWKVCIRGVPTLNTWFIVGASDKQDGLVFQVEFYFNMYGNVNVIKGKIDSGSPVDKYTGVLPVQPGVQFNMEMRIENAANTYVALVNGVEYVRMASSKPVNATNSVFFTFDLSIAYIDVWCTP